MPQMGINLRVPRTYLALKVALGVETSAILPVKVSTRSAADNELKLDFFKCRIMDFLLRFTASNTGCTGTST